MNRTLAVLLSVLAVMACTPEETEETKSTSPMAAGSPPASGGSEEGGMPMNAAGAVMMAGAVSGGQTGGVTVAGMPSQGGMDTNPIAGMNAGAAAGGNMGGNSGDPMGGVIMNPCLGMDDGAVIVSGEYGPCEFETPCSTDGVKRRTQTVCRSGAAMPTMEESAEGCRRETEGLRLVEGEYGPCTYSDECSKNGEKKRMINLCRDGLAVDEIESSSADCWRDTDDKEIALSDYSDCAYTDDCTPRAIRFRTRDICIDSQVVTRREEDSRGCERPRGDAGICDLPCPDDATEGPNNTCDCLREGYRIKADFSGCEPQAGWTILLYMHADNDLEDYSLKDIREMAEGLVPFANENEGFLDDVNIIVQIDRSQLNEDIPLFELANFSDSRRLRVIPGGVVELENLGELDFDNPEVLTDFIVWGLRAYPARRYALLFWDHGIAWSGFGGDYDNSDGLDSPMSLPDLGDGIRSALRATGLDSFQLIGFDACLMASIETAHELSDVGELLVASEDLEWGNGWNYEPVVTALVDNPDMSGEEFSQRIIDSFFRTMPTSEKTATLSMTRLPLVPQLAVAVDEIAQSMLAALEEGDGFVPVAQAVNRAQEFAQRDIVPHSRDLGGFLMRLHKALLDEDDAIKAQIQNVLEQYAAVVPGEFERHGPALPGATGLAAYMPLAVTYFRDSNVSYRNSGRFAELGGWASMFNKYHELLALDVTPPDLGDIELETTNRFVKASATLSSEDTAQAFALTFAQVDETFVFVGQAPVIPTSTPDGLQLSFQYNYDAAYLEQGETSLYAAASYDYGAWLSAMESDGLSEQALTGWVDVQFSEDEGQSWTDGTLKLSVSVRDFGHTVNGLYVESFGAVSERELRPGVWLRTLVTQIQDGALLKAPSDDMIIVGEQGLADIKFNYYLLAPEYQMYIAFMVNDYSGNQTLKWPDSPIRIPGAPCEDHQACRDDEFCDPIAHDCRAVYGIPFFLSEATGSVSETNADNLPWDDDMDEGAPDPVLQCIVGDEFVGELSPQSDTFRPVWDEQIIATFSPDSDVFISVLDADEDGLIEPIGELTIPAADLVNAVRAGRVEYQDLDGQLLDLSFELTPVYP